MDDTKKDSSYTPRAIITRDASFLMVGQEVEERLRKHNRYSYNSTVQKGTGRVSITSGGGGGGGGGGCAGCL